MKTQITCPSCQTNYVADVYQIIDAGRNPELKDALISGYLNVAQCPSCGAVTQISGPLLFHDPDHELFMVHVPIEMGLGHGEQEKLIGQLVQRAMDSLPPEERRGYMLQPQTVLSMQTFMEKVLETEGVTPEMIARQRAQSDLLQKMLDSDRETVDELINEHKEEIDETFFALLRAMKEVIDNSGDEESALKLINLQAKLYRDTKTGRRLERQQLALQELNRDIKKDNGLSPRLLLKHVLANRKEESVVQALIIAAQPAFNYEFFLLLSEKIEKRQKAGVNVSELVKLREELLALQSEFEKRSSEILEKAQSVLQELIIAEDKVAAVRSNMGRIDNMVLYLLSANLQQAEERGNLELSSALKEIQTIISDEVEKQAPPEIRMVNRLLRAKDLEDRQRILDENRDLIKPELVQVINLLIEDAQNRGQEELGENLELIRSLIEVRVEA